MNVGDVVTPRNANLSKAERAQQLADARSKLVRLANSEEWARTLLEAFSALRVERDELLKGVEAIGALDRNPAAKDARLCIARATGAGSREAGAVETELLTAALAAIPSERPPGP